VTTPTIIIAIELENGARPLQIVVSGRSLDAIAADEHRLQAWLSRPATRARLLAEVETLLDRVAAWEFVDDRAAA